jgi:hypothetical protein
MTKPRSLSASVLIVTSAALALALVSTLPHCGSSSSSASPSVSAVIGASGGTITSGDGALTVTVPPGALSANVTITIASTTLPSGGIGAAYEISPSGTSFAVPAVMEYRYGSLNLDGLSFYQIQPAIYESGEWQALPGFSYDTTAQIVSGLAPHLSIHGLASVVSGGVSFDGGGGCPVPWAGPQQACMGGAPLGSPDRCCEPGPFTGFGPMCGDGTCCVINYQWNLVGVAKGCRTDNDCCQVPYAQQCATVVDNYLGIASTPACCYAGGADCGGGGTAGSGNNSICCSNNCVNGKCAPFKGGIPGDSGLDEGGEDAGLEEAGGGGSIDAGIGTSTDSGAASSCAVGAELCCFNRPSSGCFSSCACECMPQGTCAGNDAGMTIVSSCTTSCCLGNNGTFSCECFSGLGTAGCPVSCSEITGAPPVSTCP